MNSVAYKEKYLSKYPWINSYYRAKNRCKSKFNERYKCYGGRGIKFLLTKEDVKNAWNRYRASDMKQPSIDRINNEGHYEPRNIRFIELSDNCRKRRNIKLSFDKAIEIRKLHKLGYSFTDIAKKFKVFRTAISRVVNNETWRIK